MSKIILAVTGMTGSGKSEAVKHLEKKCFIKIYFGGVTLEEIKKIGLEINEANERKIREELRQKYGMAAFALLNLEKIEKAWSENKVVIDGLYSWDEYKVLKDKFGENLVLLAVASSFKIRCQRLAKRPGRSLSKEEVKTRDYAEIENVAKGGPIAVADYTLVNDGTMEELHKKIDEILNDLNL
ncbi:AAA family ATPase [Patescibacteria group bacterium]|nr:AAA family ATPase [Patescibacteria group bacterium]